MTNKLQAKHKELIALISTKKGEFLAEERLFEAMKAQQTAWEDYKDKECELIGVLSGVRVN